MKIIIICIALLSFTLIVSCDKQTPLPNQIKRTENPNRGNQEKPVSNEFHVTVKDNRLVFQSRADYELVVNNPKENVRTEFIETVKAFTSFTSYANSTTVRNINTSELINDTYFSLLLNTDLAIQIGGNIYKVDPLKEKVFVLPVSQENHYSDLVKENTSFPDIRVYSTGDNVLDLVEMGVNRDLFCTESGIGGKADSQPFKDTYLYATYTRWGIYFSLRAYIVTGSVNTYHFDMNPVYYHVRCGKTVGPYQAANSAGDYSFVLGCQEYQSYQGSTNLNELYFVAKIRDNSTSPTTYSANVVLRANY